MAKVGDVRCEILPPSILSLSAAQLPEVLFSVLVQHSLEHKQQLKEVLT